MPCISGKYDNNIGIIIKASVTETNALQTNQIQPANLPIFNALIDTGATRTCISQQVVQAVRLHPSGQLSMASASHVQDVNAYIVDFVIPFGNFIHHVSGLTVMEFLGNNNYQILIGRDILIMGALQLSFDSHFTFCL